MSSPQRIKMFGFFAAISRPFDCSTVVDPSRSNSHFSAWILGGRHGQPLPHHARCRGHPPVGHASAYRAVNAIVQRTCRPRAAARVPCAASARDSANLLLWKEYERATRKVARSRIPRDHSGLSSFLQHVGASALGGASRASPCAPLVADVLRALHRGRIVLYSSLNAGPSSVAPNTCRAAVAVA
jgi:hypothetical protein